MAIFHQAENIMERFVWKFCGGPILNKFLFGCIIAIQINLKKKPREHALLKADKQFNEFLHFFEELC